MYIYYTTGRKWMLKSQHNRTVFNWWILSLRVIGRRYWLFFVANRMAPETTLCVKQTTTDICSVIIKIKVNMLNTAENLCIERALTAFVSLNTLWHQCSLLIGKERQCYYAQGSAEMTSYSPHSFSLPPSENEKGHHIQKVSATHQHWL